MVYVVVRVWRVVCKYSADKASKEWPRDGQCLQESLKDVHDDGDKLFD